MYRRWTGTHYSDPRDPSPDLYGSSSHSLRNASRGTGYVGGEGRGTDHRPVSSSIIDPVGVLRRGWSLRDSSNGQTPTFYLRLPCDLLETTVGTETKEEKERGNPGRVVDDRGWGADIQKSRQDGVGEDGVCRLRGRSLLFRSRGWQSR